MLSCERIFAGGSGSLAQLALPFEPSDCQFVPSAGVEALIDFVLGQRLALELQLIAKRIGVDHPAPYSAGSVSAFRTCIRSNSVHTPSFPCHCPRVAAFEYSVDRASKKFACSTPDSMDCSQGSGFSFAP